MKRFLLVLAAIAILTLPVCASSQIEKALALIETFASGDTEMAGSLLAEDYI